MTWLERSMYVFKGYKHCLEKRTWLYGIPSDQDSYRLQCDRDYSIHELNDIILCFYIYFYIIVSMQSPCILLLLYVAYKISDVLNT